MKALSCVFCGFGHMVKALLKGISDGWDVFSVSGHGRAFGHVQHV